MEKIVQIILLALLSLATACQHEELDTSFGNDDYVEFLFTKDGNVSTRADIAEDGSGAFADGDRIGLYIEQNTGTYRHIVLTRENGTWTPRLKKSELGDGLVTLNAYYPARDDIQDEITAYTSIRYRTPSRRKVTRLRTCYGRTKPSVRNRFPETVSKCRSDMRCTGSW